ncbi:MAG: ChaN family lipoprotein [Pseudomonadota bacterium]
MLRAAFIFPILALLCAVPATADPCKRRIGDVCKGETLSSVAALLEAARMADVVIIGERHDNPDHHATQAKLVEALAPGGLAFEMIADRDEGAANADRANWINPAWNGWEMYQPIIAAAPEAVIAGGLVAKDIIRTAMIRGAATAWPEGARYRLAEPLPMDMVEDMIMEQRTAHCKALAKHSLPGMVEAQQLRDASFADAALRLHEAGHRPVVLITGNGHARTDRGVPLYLRRAASDLTVVAIGQRELERGGGLHPLWKTPFDFTIHTEAHDRGNPCETFRRKS